MTCSFSDWNELKVVAPMDMFVQVKSILFYFYIYIYIYIYKSGC